MTNKKKLGSIDQSHIMFT